VHDGRLPARYLDAQGVRVDGRQEEFIDESFVDKLHRALWRGEDLKSRGALFECVMFVALMQDIDLGMPQDDGKFHLNYETNLQVDIDPDDSTNTSPVMIGYAVLGGCIYKHALYPAHSMDGAGYVQKLGDDGPICLSGLADAMKMYPCDVAHPVLEIKAGPKS